MKARYLFIVNPIAGRGRTEKRLPSILALLERRNLVTEWCRTAQPREATELAEEGVRKGFTHIVAVGGDGTVHEVANALINLPVTLGVIPTGSGNDFAKAAGIPLELPMAIEVLLYGENHRVDVGRLGDRYFVNGLGVGLDGAVSHRFQRMSHLGGELGYLWGAIHEALTFRARSIELRTSDWEYHGRALLAGASNGQYHGGNFKLVPEAQVDDGLLDVYVIQDMLPLKRLLEIPKVRKGTHVSLPEVQIRRASWVEIVCDNPLLAHMDGEPFQLEPGVHRVEVLPCGLKIVTVGQEPYPRPEASPTGELT